MPTSNLAIWHKNRKTSKMNALTKLNPQTLDGYILMSSKPMAWLPRKPDFEFIGITHDGDYRLCVTTKTDTGKIVIEGEATANELRSWKSI